MPRLRSALVVLGAAAAVAVPSASAAAPVTLVGTVGPGFTITLIQNGKPVKTVKAGKVTFVVSDKANFHNFMLEQEWGTKVRQELTSVVFTGTKKATVTLVKGKYKYYCAPHETGMFGTFTVT